MMVSDKVHLKLEVILKEMEQEFIMMRFKFATPIGKYKNEIHDIPGIGLLTTHLTRDKLFKETIREKMLKLKRLLHYPRDQITKNRMAALRQHYFMMVYKNRGAANCHKRNWDDKSSELLAGKFLIEIFDSHISYKERK